MVFGIISGVGALISSNAVSVTIAALATAATQTAIAAGIQFGVNALGGREEIEQGRFDGFTLEGSNENHPIVRCIGPKNRIFGNLIWTHGSILEEEIHHTVESGSLVADPRVTTFAYFGTWAVGICEGVVNSIPRMWGNGLLAREVVNTIVVSGTDISAEVVFTVYALTWMRFNAPSGGSDLSELQAWHFLSITGFSNNSNNGVYVSYDSGTNPDGSTWVKAAKAFVGADEAAGASVSITQIIPPNRLIFPLPTFYIGNDTHVPDGAITLEQFPDAIPAYREVQQSASATVVDALARIFQDAGLVADLQPDASLVGLNLQGMVLTAASTPIHSLEPLMTAFNLYAQERNGKLYFGIRGTETQHTIVEADLAAHDEGTDSPRSITVTDVANFSLPSEVNVSYTEPNKVLTRRTQRERVIDAPVESILNIDLPITMNAQFARDIARRVLWNAYVNRQTVILFLPPSYIDIIEGDVINVTSEGITYKIKTTEITRGANFILEVKGLVEDSIAFDSFSPGIDDDEIIDILPETSPVLFSIVDIAPFTPGDENRGGIYLFGTRSASRTTWQGAELWESDDDTTYDFRGLLANQSTMGICSSTLPSGPLWIWDEISTVDVVMENGTLSSLTKADVLVGKNVAVIGNEVIGFVNASLSNGVYTLSVLLRGLRNTQAELGSHVADERFLMVDPQEMGFHAITSDRDGELNYYKVVPPGADIDDLEPAVQHTQKIATLSEFVPSYVQISRWQTGTVVDPQLNNIFGKVSFRTRTPTFRLPRTSNTENHLAVVDVYTVDTFIRTLPFVGGEFTYSQQAQVDDGVLVEDTPNFLINIDPLTFKIYHIDSLGRKSLPLVYTAFSPYNEP